VCTTRFARYKCPRCALQYCSLGCYKRHGEKCTEGFYADQAERELRSTRTSDEQQREMRRMLACFEARDAESSSSSGHVGSANVGGSSAYIGGSSGHMVGVARHLGGDGSEMVESWGEDQQRDQQRDQQCDQQFDQECDEDGDEEGDQEGDQEGDEDEEPELVNRLTQLLERSELNEECLSALDDEALSRFRRQAADGSLAAALQSASAWWELMGEAHLPKLGALRNEASAWRYRDDISAHVAAQAGAPPLAQSIPPIRHLIRRDVPEQIRWAMLEEVAAYVYVTRLFCCAELDDPLQASAALLHLSPTLSGAMRGPPQSAEATLLGFASRCEAPDVCTSSAFCAARMVCFSALACTSSNS